jgi:Ribosomal protein S1
VFTGVILPREVKDLERNNFQLLPGRDVEVEIVDTSLVSDDGQMVVSITKLLQQDVWADLLKKSHSDQVMTVVPTEANLGGMIVDMHGIKGFIPLSQLSPIHYPRVEDGDDEMIFARLLALVGKELKVRIVSIDEIERRIILSEREALREERDDILTDLEVGKIYDGVVSGISSYGAFVTIGAALRDWFTFLRLPTTRHDISNS